MGSSLPFEVEFEGIENAGWIERHVLEQFLSDGWSGALPSWRDVFLQATVLVDGSAVFQCMTHDLQSVVLGFPWKIGDMAVSTVFRVDLFLRPGRLLGKASIRCFSKSGSFKTGRRKLQLDVVGARPPAADPSVRQIAMKECLFRDGKIEKIPWLDELSVPAARRMQSGTTYLLFKFPDAAAAEVGADPKLLPAYDPASLRENPCQLSAARQTRFAVDERCLKPDAAARSKLEAVLNLTCLDDLSSEDKVLLWSFRHFIARDPRGLAKFLRCIDWQDEKESGEARTLLRSWCKVELRDVLELLSGEFRVEEVRSFAVHSLSGFDDDELIPVLLQIVQALRYDRGELAALLCMRSLHNSVFCSLLFWYSSVESFSEFLDGLLRYLRRHGKESMIADLESQLRFIDYLKSLSESLEKEKNRHHKAEALRKRLAAANTSEMNVPGLDGCSIKRFLEQEASVFKSAKQPFRIPMLTTAGEYSVIFKYGDDLRQDQLVMNLVQLMDSILRRNGLDLRLVVYRVLATSKDCGLVECVPDVTALSEVDLGKFLDASASENLVRSCAGYSVMTFLLGVGDRHLDNLLILRDGRMFHIDYGYLMGRDPKGVAPMMRLTKELAAAMRDKFDRFVLYSVETFLILRKHAHLILNLLVLMTDAGLPDISGIHVKKVSAREHLCKVKERFKLDVGDAEAARFIVGVIDESLSAFFPQITEIIHRIAQQFRN